MSQEAEAIGIGDQKWMWWTGASSAQLAAGVVWCRRGYTGSGGSMPLKAFGAASLFVSALASAATASFFASGFESVEDVKDAGERFRRWMGALPKDTTAR
ncbi:hypothetical protein LUZ63_002741 [Rhynchospora breviuscula]|uniref:Uncharacterized protein n=1 Tax=Rhynchospora breviuscula TaxID=2022672 RepID=A0A9Q0CZA8_9POAL|nr:hypothetical protein LUZ63_002741 [Rhynchospora breviuscula]